METQSRPPTLRVIHGGLADLPQIVVEDDQPQVPWIQILMDIAQGMDDEADFLASTQRESSENLSYYAERLREFVVSVYI